MGIILRHNWHRQPQTPVVIDPAYKPIAFYHPKFIPAYRFLNARVPRIHTIHGVEAAYDASELQREYVTRNGQINGVSDFSIVTLLTPISGGVSGDRGVIGNWSSTSASSYSQVVHRAQSYSGVEYTWRFFYKPTPSSTQVGIDAINNSAIIGKQSCIIACAGNGSIGLYHDGVLHSSAAVDTPQCSGQSDIVSGGYYDNASSRRLVANIALIAVLGVKLDTKCALDVSVNPWQLLRPLSRRLWVGAAVAEGTDELPTPTGITVTPVLGSPSLGQIHVLGGDGVAVTPILGSPALGQVHVLATPTGVTVTPVLGSPQLTEVSNTDALPEPDGVTVTPVLGSPALGQIHNLSAPTGVVVTPVLGSPELTAAAGVDALPQPVGVTVEPALGSPALGQVHVLGGDGVTVQPVLGSPLLGQVHVLSTPTGVVVTPVLGAPTLTAYDVALITADEVAQTVRASSRVKTVISPARVKAVRYAIS